jgi:hypothetical protein
MEAGQPVPVTPTQPLPVTPDQPAAPSPLFEQARQLGIDTAGYQNDQQFLAGMAERSERATELEPYAQLGQQLAPYSQQIQELLSTGQLQQGQPAPAAPPEEDPLASHYAKTLGAPQYDPAWEGLVELDPTSGTYIGKTQHTPWIATSGMNAYRDWQKQHFEKLGSPDALNYIAEGLRPYIEKIAGEQNDQRFSEHQANQDYAALDRQNETWLYHHDTGGGVQMSQQGQAMLTPDGQKFYGHMADLQTAGMSDPIQIYEQALVRMQAERSMQPPAQPQVQPVQPQLQSQLDPAVQPAAALAVQPAAALAVQPAAALVPQSPVAPVQHNQLPPQTAPIQPVAHAGPPPQPLYSPFDAAAHQASYSGTMPSGPGDTHAQNEAPSNGEGYFMREAVAMGLR